jgi:hypothetical protein
MIMVSKRVRAAFWERGKPARRYDIAALRPTSLPKGKRFETIDDCDQESLRSEQLLPSPKLGRSTFRQYLSECRDGDYDCHQTYCPRCARTFRRWFIGEVLRVSEGQRRPVHMATVLLEAAPSDKIDTLDPEQHRAQLRKRLRKAGLGETPVVGGFEMVYRARDKLWLLHINLVIVGGTKKALEKFKDDFDDSAIDRPVVRVPVKDRPEQLSYVLKFTTYHRPYKQTGSSKSPAKSLNRREHQALVRWMSRFEFKGMMFLFNARRAGAKIVLREA